MKPTNVLEALAKNVIDRATPAEGSTGVDQTAVMARSGEELEQLCRLLLDSLFVVHEVRPKTWFVGLRILVDQKNGSAPLTENGFVALREVAGPASGGTLLRSYTDLVIEAVKAGKRPDDNTELKWTV